MHKRIALILLLTTTLMYANKIQQESQQWIEKTWPLRRALAKITGPDEIKQKRKNGLLPPLDPEVHAAVKATSAELREIIKLCNQAYNFDNYECALRLFKDVEDKFKIAQQKLEIAQALTVQKRAHL